PVTNYGTGFSPYFIPLALWVGALVMFFVVTPISASGIEGHHPSLIVALGSYWPAALVATAQAVIMLVVLRLGLGLTPVNAPALYGFVILSALVFVAIIQWLSGTFGIAGKFLAVVLLMLQLTSAAGTFPLQLVAPFFQTISRYLPMTYVVAGLRQAISGGDLAALRHDALILACYGMAAIALMTVTARRAKSWSRDRLQHGIEL
ncbi:MAG: YhgE/Pip domain-containing protein, partial [Actinobacteria bacterium]